MTAIQTQEFDFSLPEPSDVFIGREKELKEIFVGLREGKNIVITGPKGAGKKSLAVRAALIYSEVFKEELKGKIPFLISFRQNSQKIASSLEVEDLKNSLKDAAIVVVESNLAEITPNNKIIKQNELTLKSKVITLAKENSIPVIYILEFDKNNEILLRDEFVAKYHYDDLAIIQLGGFTYDEAYLFFSSKGINLRKEELAVLLNLTKGLPKFLVDFTFSFNLHKEIVTQFKTNTEGHSELELSEGFSKKLDLDSKLSSKERIEVFKGILENPDDYFQNFLETLTLRTSSKYSLTLLNLYYNLGLQYFRSENYRKALGILLRVRQLAKKYEELYILALTLLQLGHLYKKIANLYKSRLAYKDALRMFLQINDEPNIAETAASLAALEILQGRTTDARSHLDQARQYYEKENKPKAVQKIDDLFETADYVDGAQMLQGRSNGVLV